VPVKSAQELIAYGKANPGKLLFGSSGTGGLQHFAGQLFKHLSGAKLTHISYKGTSALIAARLANEVQVGFATLFGVRPHRQSGRLCVVAIAAAKRPVVEPIPTLAEAGVLGFEVDQYYGVITGARMPKPVVDKLSSAMAQAL
jgi:tripartite-type tricarboxylate transporter receptor subunit TctC